MHKGLFQVDTIGEIQLKYLIRSIDVKIVLPDIKAKVTQYLAYEIPSRLLYIVIKTHPFYPNCRDPELPKIEDIHKVSVEGLRSFQDPIGPEAKSVISLMLWPTFHLSLSSPIVQFK